MSGGATSESGGAAAAKGNHEEVVLREWRGGQSSISHRSCGSVWVREWGIVWGK